MAAGLLYGTCTKDHLLNEDVHCTLQALETTLTLFCSDDMQQSTLAPVDRLLLDIYETIEEPDGIYAIARSHQARMQAALFEHEGAQALFLLSLPPHFIEVFRRR